MCGMARDVERYSNGQPVGYSNRNLCEKCAGDLGDCNCTAPPEYAALLLGICEHAGPDGQVFLLPTDIASLRALAGMLEQSRNGHITCMCDACYRARWRDA
jgi:hypothetical protein